MRTGSEIQSLIEQGENGGIEFERSDVRPESLAREVAAFSNANSGSICPACGGGMEIYLRLLL